MSGETYASAFYGYSTKTTICEGEKKVKNPEKIEKQNNFKIRQNGTIARFFFITNSLLSKAIGGLAPFFFPLHLWKQPSQPSSQSRWQSITWYFWTLAIITLFVTENPGFVTVLGPMVSGNPPENSFLFLFWVFSYPIRSLVQNAWLLFLVWGLLAIPLWFLALWFGNKLFAEKTRQKNVLSKALSYALLFVVVALSVPIFWMVIVLFLSQALMALFMVGKETGTVLSWEETLTLLSGGGILFVIAFGAFGETPQLFSKNSKMRSLIWAIAQFIILIFLIILSFAYLHTIIQSIQRLF